MIRIQRYLLTNVVHHDLQDKLLQRKQYKQSKSYLLISELRPQIPHRSSE